MEGPQQPGTANADRGLFTGIVPGIPTACSDEPTFVFVDLRSAENPSPPPPLHLLPCSTSTSRSYNLMGHGMHNDHT
eukprot:261590-Amphidinium_carterae.1